MPKRIPLRELSKEERKEIARLAKARTEPVNLVMRASVIQAMVEDPKLPPSQAGRKAGFATDATGIAWVKRFNAEGTAGLQDRERAGRPRTHSEEVRSQLISLALQKPRSLGYPHELWTLERLQTAFLERHGDYHTVFSFRDGDGNLVSSPTEPAEDLIKLSNSGQFDDRLKRAILNNEDHGLDVEEMDIDGEMTLKLRHNSATDFTSLATKPDEVEDIFLVIQYRLAQ